MNSPLTPSVARFWADLYFGCPNGTPSGTITFTAVGPVGGRITGSFSDVVVAAASDNAPCAPNVQPGVMDVVLSGTFDVTRTR